MRKYLGILALASVCGTTWAQAPASAPPQNPASAQAPAAAPAQTPAPAPTTAPTKDQTQNPPAEQTPSAELADIPNPTAKPEAAARPYPRIELFGGGTYAEVGLFNSGHWAGLPGWDASFALNATRWLGFVVEGGQYFGTSKIPSAVPAPFPTCGGNPSFCPPGSTFDVTTREYNFLFGLQFARRKSENWTPFGELLIGHQGVRGRASAAGATFTEIGTGRAFVAGGGLDHRINDRFALRFKADYFQTGTDFPLLRHRKQDNFRFSVGIVIRNVHKKKRTLEDETAPE